MIPSRHFTKRADPVSRPSGDGIGPGITQSHIINNPSGLVIDSTASSFFQSLSGSPVASSFALVLTPTSTSPEFTLPSTPTLSTPPSSAAETTRPISIGTVIGICVGLGALFVVGALIIFCLWFCGHDVKTPKKHGRLQRALCTPRHSHASRRSYLMHWNRLEEGDDHRQSIRQTEVVPDLPIARRFLGRVDAGSAISLDGGSIGENSYIDGRGDVSNKAIATPVMMKSQSHHWEGTETVQYAEPEQTSAQFAKSQDTFENDLSEQRSSTDNPFFSAQACVPIRRPRSNTTHSARSPSTSIQSHSTSISTAKPKVEEPKVDKSNDELDDDVFADDNIPALSRPFATAGSLSSVPNNDPALQSLITASSAEEAQERLHITVSITSYTGASGNG
ncbi:hypothetical protein C0992_005820 [Termitomyces sp. T32_za158]|nr:hypothetical protein C0992_005820 [Termitomyces sp. T32_za158]